MQEQDQFGNPTTTAETVDLSSDSSGTYLFSTSADGSGPTGPGTVDIPSGSSSATFYYGDTKAGSPTLTATADGLGSANQQETVTPGPPTDLVFTSQAVSGHASSDAALGPITVAEEDQFGNPTTTAETIHLSSDTSGSYLFSTSADGSGPTGPGTVDIPSGNSSATFYYGDTKAGSPTLTATADGLGSANQEETVTPGSPVALVFTTDRLSGPASSDAALGPVAVAEEDQFGNPTTTAETILLSSDTSGTYLFSTSADGSGPTGPGTVDIPSGSSSATFYYGDTKAGSPTLTAAADGLGSANQQESVTPGPPGTLVFTSQAMSGQASADAALGPITVAEEDQFGNPTTTAETIHLSSDTSGTYLFSTSADGSGPTGPGTVDIRSGSSSASFYYGDTKVGRHTVTARAGDLAVASQQETVTPGAAATLVFTTESVSGDASSTANLGPIAVAEEDQFGNLATQALTLQLSSSSPGPYLFSPSNGGSGPAGPSTIAIGAGTSSATFYYGDAVPGTPTITVTATGLDQASQRITVAAAPAPPPEATQTLPTVAVQGPNHSLWVYWLTATGQWLGPLGVGDAGSTYSAPSLAVGPSGLPTIAVQGPDDSLWIYWFSISGQWLGPLGVGARGSTYSAPSLAIGPSGLPTIAVEGPNDGLWIYWLVSTGQWLGPLGVGSTVAAPSLAIGPSGLPTIAVEGPNDGLWIYWLASTGQWLGPLGVGSTFAAPSLMVGPSGLPTVAVEGPSSSLWLYWMTTDAQWLGPLGIGGTGSTFDGSTLAEPPTGD